MVAIINVSLKVGKRNYWVNVLPALVSKFGIPAKLYQNDMYIKLSNGSLVYILGADKRDAIEDIRGAQFDLVIIDEAKSYPALLLRELISEVVQPTLRDRKGTLLMIGTPGSLFQGPFFEATYPGHETVTGSGKNQKKRLTSRNFSEPEPFWQKNSSAKLRPLWSRHSWLITDNVALPHLWQEALDEKEDNGWADDEPIWLRESLAQWVIGADEFVYAYANLAGSDPELVHWTPDYERGNKFGLYPADDQWRYLLGLDVGYEDAFAMVVGAYNKHDGVLYHLWDHHEAHLDPIAQAQAVESAIRKFGRFDAIVADPGGGGKGLIEMMKARMAIPARVADKTQKPAYREFLNADFRAGKIKLLPKSDLATQLSTLQFDMSSGRTKEELARREKLIENQTQANDLCDAFLYMWRHSYHYYRKERPQTTTPGTPEHDLEMKREAMADYAKSLDLDKQRPDWTRWAQNVNPIHQELARRGSN